MTGGYELFLFPWQGSMTIGGHALEALLRKEKPEAFKTTLESSLVRGWIDHPETYPKELRAIYPVLWGMTRGRGDDREVKRLVFHRRVRVLWFPLRNVFFPGDSPALLAK